MENIPTKHFDRLIAWEMKFGATYEEAEEIVKNSVAGKFAHLKDALDFTINVFEDVLRDMKK